MKTLRIALVLLIGCALAGIAGFLTWRSMLGLHPSTMSLAYRIAPERTALFVRTPDLEELRTVVRLFVPDSSMPESFASLPEGIQSYEAAILKNASGGTLPWILFAHTGSGKYITLTSDDNIGLFLPLKEAGRSLEHDKLFEGTVTETLPRLLLMDTHALILPQKPASDLLATALTNIRRALMLWDASSGTLFLELDHPSSMIAEGQLPNENSWSGTGTVFALSIAKPAPLLAAWGDALRERNPALYEGLSGIAMHATERILGSTDLQVLGESLLSKPTSLVLTEGGDDVLNVSLLLYGNAEEDRINRWRSALQSNQTVGTVRARTFDHGNERTDIALTSADARTSTVGNWTIAQGDARGNTLMGTKGRTFLFVIGSFLPHPYDVLFPDAIPQHNEVKIASMTLSIRWLVSTLQSGFPVIGSDVASLAATFPHLPERVAIDAQTSAYGITVHWVEAPAGSTGKR
jgi:hypothetical protein